MKRFSFLGQLISDIFSVARRDKKWWLVPLIIVLFLLAGLLVLGALAGPLAPFLYPLF